VSWLDPRVEVRPSTIHGLGLFARDPIRAGVALELLGGTIVSHAEVRSIIAGGGRYDGIALDAERDLMIEPSDWPGIHGNHSCDPNLGMADAVTIEARRDVSAGSELLIDYAMFTLDPDWSMRCKCGSGLCRGRVTGDDWRRPELQRRYRGHFAPVLERLIHVTS
jgi:hypothetical protein